MEKQQRQPSSENSHCQSKSTKQLSVESEKKQEQFRETDCSKTANHKNDSEIIRERTVENLRPEYNVSLSLESPVTKLSYLDTNRTPVSSRTMKRTDLMRGSKIDFDKKQIYKASNSDNIIKSVDSKPCELSTSASVTDWDSCAVTGTIGTCREAGKDGSGMVIFLAHLSRRLTGELIVYPCSGVHPLSVRRPQFQRSSPLKPLGQSKPNFMWSILRKGE